MSNLSEAEIINILQNVICDEVIGTYCIEIQKQGVKCDENCKNDDCYLFNAIQGLLDLYKAEKEKNKELESADLTSVYMNGFYDGEKKWKDKIKEKIEKLNKEKNEIEQAMNNKLYTYNSSYDLDIYKIEALEELLKGE